MKETPKSRKACTLCHGGHILPCFIRVIQRLGVKLPTDPVFNEWLERELMREFTADTHEELRTNITYYEMYRPEELKEVVRRLLEKWQKRRLKEEALIV